MYRTLLIDADGVLQHQPNGWEQHIVSLTGLPSWSAVETLEQPLMRGADVAEHFDRSLPDKAVASQDIIDAWNVASQDVAALSLIDRVRAKGIGVYLASNQQAERSAWLRTTVLADHVDGMFLSGEMGLAKPDPAFFTEIIRRLKVDPSEVLFIDDLKDNVIGARLAGLDAVQHHAVTGARGLERKLRENGLL